MMKKRDKSDERMTKEMENDRIEEVANGENSTSYANTQNTGAMQSTANICTPS